MLPLDDRSPQEILGVERPSEEAPRERYIYQARAAAAMTVD